MQRSWSDWADPEDGGEEEAVDRGAVAVSVGSGIRGRERYFCTVGDKEENQLREE
jgi:hypothetical protein